MERKDNATTGVAVIVGMEGGVALGKGVAVGIRVAGLEIGAGVGVSVGVMAGAPGPIGCDVEDGATSGPSTGTQANCIAKKVVHIADWMSFDRSFMGGLLSKPSSSQIVAD